MKRFALALLMMLVLAGGAIAWVVGTESGLRWLWQETEPLRPAGLQVEAIHGRLIGPLQVRGVAYRHAGTEVSVAALRLAWSPWALLRGRLRLSAVEIDEPRARLADGGDADGPGTAFVLPRLPLAVSVGRLTLTDLRVHAGENRLVADRLALTASLDERGLRVRDLDAAGPDWSALGHLRIDRGAQGPVLGRLDARWQPPARPRVEALVRVTGSRDRPHVIAELEPPYSLRADLKLAEGEDAWSLRGDFDWTEADPSVWLDRRPPDGVPNPLSLHAEVDAAIEAESVRLDELVLSSPDVASRLSGHGQWRFGPGRLEAELGWQTLRWPLTGEAMIVSPEGRIDAQGTLDDMRIALSGRLARGGEFDGEFRLADESLSADLSWRELMIDGEWHSSAGRLQADGRLDDYSLRGSAELARGPDTVANIGLSGAGDREGLQLESVEAQTLSGQVAGDGQLVWSPSLEAHLSVRGEALNPGELAPAWPGSIDGRVTARARSRRDGWHVAVSELALEGRLRGHPVVVNAVGDWSAGRLRIDSATVGSSDNRLRTRGTVGEGWDLRWRLQGPDLAAIWPGLDGSLSGQGRLAGPLARPRVVADLSGSELHYSGYALDTVRAALDVDLAGTRGSEMSVNAQGLRTPSLTAERIEVIGDGRPTDHTLDLAFAAPQGELSLRAAGEWRWRPWQWQFRLTQGRVGPPADRAWSTWRLAGTANGRIDAQSARIDRHCWRQREASACLALERDPDMAIDARLTNLPLATWQPWLPPTLALSGDMSGEAHVRLGSGAPSIRASLTTTAGALRRESDSPDEPPTAIYDFEPIEAALSLDPDGGRAELDMRLAPSGEARLQARLGPGQGLADRSLDGTLTVALPNVTPIGEFIPAVSELDGRIDGELSLAGRLSGPSFAGRLGLRDARAVLPEPGLTLTGLSLELSGDGAGPLRLTGRAKSGGGELTLAGELDPLARRFQADVAGQAFKALDTPQAVVHVTPDLRIEGEGRLVRVRGEVRVPKADLTPRDLAAEGAVTTSPDEVIVRAEGEDGTPLRIDSEVRVVLGEAVRFEGFGLKGGVGGNLVVRQPPGELTTATGEISIEEGEYRAYGQGLKIETGRLVFTGGPVENPGLDVRAVRRPAPDVTVGVRARGTLRQPRFTLFSEPPMGQTRQLSWLVLGRDLDETSGGESNMLAQAALSLGIKGADLGAGWLKDRVGLDTFGVESEAGGPREQASFVIGKYLAPDLYVSYGIGIFEPVNVLRLRYEISEHWTLETESGAASGGDLFYSIER